MTKAQIRAAAERMRKEYGECADENCLYCCNYQKKSKQDNADLVCIAYDSQGKWDPSETACGLFNIPFRGLRPLRRELVEFFRKEKKQEPDEEQVAFL